MIHIDDNATAIDQLNRRGFAEGLSSLILNAPDVTSFRLGLYGGWGEGKTSVLAMMQKRLESSAVVCIPLVPWTAKTNEEMLEDLLLAIVNALKIPVGEEIERKEHIHTRVQALSNTIGQAKDLHPLIKIGSLVVDKLVTRSTGKLQDWKGHALLEDVTNALVERRVVVFVDDLDRVRPELLPDLLLNLRSTLDLPNLFYVLALSPQIVQEGLGKIHPGWDDPLKFLEKIIEYPVWLPTPTQNDIQEFTRQNIQLLAGVLDANVLARLSALLPHNPRQIKLFLRFLASLQGQLCRFQADEISLYALYVCQLLRIEFPTEVQRLSKHEEILMDIGNNIYDALERTRAGNKPIDPTNRPEAVFAPAEESLRHRFLDLCLSLRQAAPFGDLYPLPKLLLLLERPPILTWKELQSLYKAFENAPADDKPKPIRVWLEDDGPPTPERASALLDMAVRGRQNLLEFVAGADTKAEMQSHIPEIRIATSFLTSLILDIGLIRNGLILPEAWLTLFVHFERWAQWTTPRDIYQSLRDDEIELLNFAAEEMPEEIQEALYEPISRAAHLSIRPSSLFDTTSPALKRAAAKIAQEIGLSIASRLLSCFEQPDGIKPVWRMESHHVFRDFLFDSSSPFFAAKYRHQMSAIAKRAWRDEVVQKNFLEYFRMLAVGATSPGHNFPHDGCKQIVMDSRYIRTIWRAATARPLNHRTVGSLRRMRETLVEAGVHEDALLLPTWWKKIEIYFAEREVRGDESMV